VPLGPIVSMCLADSSHSWSGAPRFSYSWNITVIPVISVHRGKGPSLFHVRPAGRTKQYLTAHICPPCVRTYTDSILQRTWNEISTTSKTVGVLF
jgi:hypothetical protein